MSKHVRVFIAFMVLGAVFVPTSARPDVLAGYVIVRNVNVAPGLNYKKVKQPSGPNRIFVLTVNPAKAVTLDVALAGNQLGRAERTTSMAARHNAIAAINGDFGTWSGRPAFGYMEDGNLKIDPTCCPRDFAIRRNENRTFFGEPDFGMTLWELDSNERWRIHRWNRRTPSGGEIAAYTPAGGSFALPPNTGCSARLVPRGGLVWTGTGLGREYAVDRAACHDRRLSRQNAVVLSADRGTAQAQQLKTLKAGERVRLLWTFGWPGIMENMGGTPVLMRGGSIVATNCRASLCARHPRTGIGRRADGRLLLIVVDGRRRGSVGMTLVEFARLFKNLGATDALNLDGGGSSTMVVKGSIKNVPSDGRERPVVNALLVLPGRDRREPNPAGGFASAAGLAAVETVDEQEPVRLGRLDSIERFRSAAGRDPASAGGMVDALARGSLGIRPRALPADLLPLLRAFRNRTR